MNLWTPSRIYKPLGIKPRRFTEYRLKGFIKPEVESEGKDASLFNAFDALRAAFIHLGETQGLTLENAFKIPGIILTSGNLPAILPWDNIYKDNTWLITISGDPIGLGNSYPISYYDSLKKGDSDAFHEMMNNAYLFTMFTDVALIVSRRIFEKYEDGKDNVSFFNIAIFIKDVVSALSIDIVNDIYEPLNIRRKFFEKAFALPIKKQEIVFELLRSAMAGILSWRTTKEGMQKQGLDTSDLG